MRVPARPCPLSTCRCYYRELHVVPFYSLKYSDGLLIRLQENRVYKILFLYKEVLLSYTSTAISLSKANIRAILALALSLALSYDGK